VQQPFHSAVRLYNLDSDLGEDTDVAAEHADLVAKMKKLMADAYTPSERWKFPEPKK
jgi:arylsulfatase